MYVILLFFPFVLQAEELMRKIEKEEVRTWFSCLGWMSLWIITEGTVFHFIFLCMTLSFSGTSCVWWSGQKDLPFVYSEPCYRVSDVISFCASYTCCRSIFPLLLKLSFFLCSRTSYYKQYGFARKSSHELSVFSLEIVIKTTGDFSTASAKGFGWLARSFNFFPSPPLPAAKKRVDESFWIFMRWPMYVIYSAFRVSLYWFWK